MRILIADDDPVNRRLLESMLSGWGHEVKVTTNGLEAWKELKRPEAPLLAILDWSMPDMSGVEVCQEVRQREEGPYVYIILLTGKTDARDRIKGIYAGADDYVMKPFDMSELEVRLRTAQRILELQERFIAASEEMGRQALHDTLTGFFNRRAVDEILEREISRSRQTGDSLSLVLCRVDQLKRIYHSLGREKGSGVIREICSRIRVELRPYDVGGIYDEDEILLILPSTDLSGAQVIAEQISKRVHAEKIAAADSARVAISMGVTAFEASSHADLPTLLDAARQMLHR